MKVLHYVFTYTDGKSVLLPFTQSQASTVGAILDRDGISVEQACAIVAKWNREGEGVYKYSIPIEDELSMIDKPKKQSFDFSIYKQFPVRLHETKDAERIAKVAHIQKQGASFADFVRNALDNYTIKNNGE